MISKPAVAAPAAAPAPADPKKEKKVKEWINGAPDGRGEAPRKPLMKGNREQISHTIPPDLLARLDAYAPTIGQKRAGAINLAIEQLLANGITLAGARRGDE